MTAYARSQSGKTSRVPRRDQAQIASAEHADVMSALEEFKGKGKSRKAQNCFARQDLDLLLKQEVDGRVCSNVFRDSAYLKEAKYIVV